MNKYDPNIHHRRSIRLLGFDYSQQGLYFITICVHNFKCIFGRVTDDTMVLNDPGKMIENEWLKLSNRFSNIQINEYVVMPNHFHAILEIKEAKEMTDQKNCSNQNNQTVGNMIAVFKSISTVKYIDGVKNLRWHPFDDKLWQRNYWDNVISDSITHQLIIDYILNNPLKWGIDKLNPKNM